MRRWTGVTAAALTGCLLLSPSVAFAQDLEPEPVENPGSSQAAAAAVETTTEVSLPVVGDKAQYLLGSSGPVSATVARASDSGPIAGTVEFFDGDVSLGSAPISGSGESATAKIETDRWPAGGARQVTATFTPEDGSDLAGSTSEPRAYRVVDTSRVVPDIELDGTTDASITDATLDWTIANIWFSNFSVGFEREVLSGPVTLPEMQVGETTEERQAYFSRPFTFGEGTGTRDGAGNRVISYTGSVRLTSGTGNRWDFADPEVHIAANGDGYITAEFSGFYVLGERTIPYGPVRVTVATFNDAELTSDESGRVSAEIVLNWKGQANGAGTWARDYDESFPNEFVSLLHPAIALFFARSSVATDDSKIPKPVRLSFAESASLPFTDVDSGSVHYPGIQWVYDQGITTGTSADKFSPKKSVTRAQMALFLYRLAGEPDVTLPEKSPFPDLDPSARSYKAINWLVQEEITNGVKKGGKLIFDGSSTVTRGQMSAFLYRYSGSPEFEAPEKSSIDDVPVSNVFYKEISWLADRGITTPYTTSSGDVVFRPKNDVLREQMATFLYRLETNE